MRNACVLALGAAVILIFLSSGTASAGLGAPTTIALRNNKLTMPSAALHNSTIYVAWMQTIGNTYYSTDGEIMFASSSDGRTFSSKTLGHGYISKSAGALVEVTASGRIFIVWQESLYQLRCALSTDGGSTFDVQTTLSTNGTYEFSSAVVDEELYVVWTTEAGGYSARQTISIAIVSQSGNALSAHFHTLNIPANNAGYYQEISGLRIVSDGHVPYIFYTYSQGYTYSLRIHTSTNAFDSEAVHEIMASGGYYTKYFGVVRDGALYVGYYNDLELYVAWCNQTTLGPSNIAYSMSDLPDMSAIAVDASGRILVSAFYDGLSQYDYAYERRSSNPGKFTMLETDPGGMLFHENWTEPLLNYDVAGCALLVEPSGITYSIWLDNIAYDTYRLYCAKWWERGDPPVAKIISPSASDAIYASDKITFDGSASEGDGLTYQWTSSVSGMIGTTAMVNATLPAGHQQITLAVKDSSGRTARQYISLNVMKMNDLADMADGWAIATLGIAALTAASLGLGVALAYEGVSNNGSARGLAQSRVTIGAHDDRKL